MNEEQLGQYRVCVWSPQELVWPVQGPEVWPVQERCVWSRQGRCGRCRGVVVNECTRTEYAGCVVNECGAGVTFSCSRTKKKPVIYTMVHERTDQKCLHYHNPSYTCGVVSYTPRDHLQRTERIKRAVAHAKMQLEMKLYNFGHPNFLLLRQQIWFCLFVQTALGVCILCAVRHSRRLPECWAVWSMNGGVVGQRWCGGCGQCRGGGPLWLKPFFGQTVHSIVLPELVFCV